MSTVSYEQLYLEEKEKYLQLKGGGFILPGFYYIFFNSEIKNSSPTQDDMNPATPSTPSKNDKKISDFLNLLKEKEITSFQPIPSFETIVSALPSSFVVGNNEKLSTIKQGTKKSAYFSNMFEKMISPEKQKKIREEMKNKIKAKLTKAGKTIDNLDKILSSEFKLSPDLGEKNFSLVYNKVSKHYNGDETKFRQELKKTNELAKEIIAESNRFFNAYAVIEVGTFQNRLLYLLNTSTSTSTGKDNINVGGSFSKAIKLVGCWAYNIFAISVYIGFMVALAFSNMFLAILLIDNNSNTNNDINLVDCDAYADDKK